MEQMNDLYMDDELDSEWARYVAALRTNSAASDRKNQIRKTIEARERETMINLQKHVRGLSRARFELEDTADMDSFDDSSSETGTVNVLDTPLSDKLQQLGQPISSDDSDSDSDADPDHDSNALLPPGNPTLSDFARSSSNSGSDEDSIAPTPAESKQQQPPQIKTVDDLDANSKDSQYTQQHVHIRHEHRVMNNKLMSLRNVKRPSITLSSIKDIDDEYDVEGDDEQEHDESRGGHDYHGKYTYTARMSSSSSQSSPSESKESVSDAYNTKLDEIRDADCNDSDSTDTAPGLASGAYSNDSHDSSSASPGSSSPDMISDDDIDHQFKNLQMNMNMSMNMNVNANKKRIDVNEIKYDAEFEEFKQELNEYKTSNFDRLHRTKNSRSSPKHRPMHIDCDQLADIAKQAQQKQPALDSENLSIATSNTECKATKSPIHVSSNTKMSELVILRNNKHKATDYEDDSTDDYDDDAAMYNHKRRKAMKKRKKKRKQHRRLADPYDFEWNGLDPDDYFWNDPRPDGACVDDSYMSLRNRRIQFLVVMAIENNYCRIADLTNKQNDLLLLYQQSLRF